MALPSFLADLKMTHSSQLGLAGYPLSPPLRSVSFFISLLPPWQDFPNTNHSASALIDQYLTIGVCVQILTVLE